MRYAALLRGVNVGGHAKLPMTDLRETLTSLGHADVTTYLQSGNAVFTTEQSDPEGLGREIEDAIAERLGLHITVLIRSGEDLASVVTANPFPEAAATPKLLHATFLSAQPDAARLAEIDSSRFEPEEFRLGDRVLYLSVPNGLGRSKIATYPWERRLGLRATSRNWNTVTKLVELTGA